MDVTPQAAVDTAGQDALAFHLSHASGHLERVADGLWEGTDLRTGAMVSLQSIERVHFSDASVALDTQGAAVAALIAVTLGTQSLKDKAVTTEGLALIDSGWSTQAIGAAALSLAMGRGQQHSAQETVQWLWSRSHDSEGTAEQLQPYVQLLQSGALTVGDLAWELAGVQQHGLVYSPMGV